ncbi:MAG: hydantoinase/oxoprolinase family protein, partial [Firmicutes bacterium]|nr:hydantoinase/oxoprolinase family protein [Bacillota bacterium]
MKKIMGIDTGGTYTDTVIISADTRQVLAKHKTPTEKTNLCESIEKCFNAMPEEMLKDISMVCLSTTLATNAIVEGHGCKNGLILIGSRPKGMLACRNVALVKGKFDIKGRVREQLDLEEIDRVIESFRGQVDSIAISGYASVRNPSHEIYVKNRIEEKLGIPVACAHELTSSLGFYDRTVTVDLNARLIPLLAELMDAVRSVMTERNLNVPLMVVKGDGSLMTEACARSKPIDTILSGPASSVIGGVFLSGEKDAFVIDMGGTTTDIADVTDGVARIRDEGARVGGWFTHVRATEVFTLGLGGDSRIYINSRGKITIGPEKSITMSAAEERWPELIGELRHIRDCGSYKNFKFHDHEAYALIRKYEKLSYTDEEKILIEILRGGPRTKDYLKNNINMSKLQQLLDDLTKAGVVARLSLTPTAILHLTGEYAMYDKHIAEIIVDIVAGLYGKECEEFIEEVCDLMRVKLDCAGIEAALYFDHHEVDMREG